MENDIAIVGVSFKMPQDAVDEAGLWDILSHKRNVMTEWPPSRANVESFYNSDPTHFNKVRHCPTPAILQVNISKW